VWCARVVGNVGENATKKKKKIFFPFFSKIGTFGLNFIRLRHIEKIVNVFYLLPPNLSIPN
jgi:hypothetical protein